MSTTWDRILELDNNRQIVSGSHEALAAAIARGADLRIATEFFHDEHIDTSSDNHERIREVAQFAVTYLIDHRWAAGIMSLRQPIELPAGFGARPSMSFFLYNQDGRQAIARPHLDGGPATETLGPSPNLAPAKMPKYHVESSWDAGSNAPSQNFVYDFESFRYFVCDRWREVLAHDAQGRVERGSVKELAEAAASGAVLKIAVAGLCDDLVTGTNPLPHELFVEIGSAYEYTRQNLFIAGTHPVIRVKPAIPLRYESRGWDFGWLMARSDGHVVYRRCDPYMLKFEDRAGRYPLRWFVA
jgi:hypothetical protein